MQNNPKTEVQKSLLIGLKITIFSLIVFLRTPASEIKHLCPFHRYYIHFQPGKEFINFTIRTRNLSFIQNQTSILIGYTIAFPFLSLENQHSVPISQYARCSRIRNNVNLSQLSIFPCIHPMKNFHGHKVRTQNRHSKHRAKLATSE